MNPAKRILDLKDKSLPIAFGLIYFWIGTVGLQKQHNYLLWFQKLPNGWNKPYNITTFFSPWRDQAGWHKSTDPLRICLVVLWLTAEGQGISGDEQQSGEDLERHRSSERDLSDKSQNPVSQRERSGLTHHSRLVAIDQEPFDGNLHSHLWNGQLAASSRPQAPTKTEVKKQFTHKEKKTTI